VEESKLFAEGSLEDITGGKGVYNQWIHCDLIVIF